jgi:hypothetical protein
MSRITIAPVLGLVLGLAAAPAAMAQGAAITEQERDRVGAHCASRPW